MNKVERLRIGLISTLGLIVGVVVIYSTLYALDWLPEFGSDTENYVILDRPLETDPIEVVEFFSYGCGFCNSLEDFLDGWRDDLPDDVTFRQMHVIYDTLTGRLARAHLVLQSQGLLDTHHAQLFEAIHSKNMIFTNDDRLAEELAGENTSKDRFLSAMQSSQINRRIQANDAYANEVGARSVPSMLVANKYMVFAGGGNRDLLNTVDWLIDEIQAGRAPTKPVEEDTSSDSEEDVDSAEATDVSASEEQIEGETETPSESQEAEAAPEDSVEADEETEQSPEESQ